MVETEIKKIKILGFSGSLRKGSYNKMLLNAAFDLTPDNAEMEIFAIDNICPFNQDEENNPSDTIKSFKEKILAADGILIVTPEYNYSIPGVLKNAIDAVSRPYGNNPFDGKPVGIMGASIGMIGSARSQYHLRQSMVFLNAFPMNKPEVMVPFAQEKFDGNGKLMDETTRQKVQEFMVALVKWIKKIKS